MALVECPFCKGDGIETVMCKRRFACQHCMGEGVIEESKLKEAKIPSKWYVPYSKNKK